MEINLLGRVLSRQLYHFSNFGFPQGWFGFRTLFVVSDRLGCPSVARSGIPIQLIRVKGTEGRTPHGYFSVPSCKI